MVDKCEGEADMGVFFFGNAVCHDTIKLDTRHYFILLAVTGESGQSREQYFSLITIVLYPLTITINVDSKTNNANEITHAR